MPAPMAASRVGNAGTGELSDPRVDNNEELIGSGAGLIRLARSFWNLRGSRQRENA